MKILYLSDIHFEFHKDRGKGFFLELNKFILGHLDIEAIIIAGDLCTSHDDHKFFLSEFGKHANLVFFVPGNHDFYHYSIAAKNLFFESLNVGNVFILQNDVVHAQGQNFVGATLWYHDEPEIHLNGQFPDLKYINGRVKFDIFEENRKNKDFFYKNVDRDSIVISHHLPTFRSIGNVFLNSPLNPFFVEPKMEQIIASKEPKVWIHGHTHQASDYRFFGTRILCNPFGYPFENTNFMFRILEI